MSDFLEVDGSTLGGGGQILRIAISLSAILGIPVRVAKIRAHRPKPGLAAQHVAGIRLVSKMCQATVKGACIGSSQVEFRPGKLVGGDYEADPKTAGSISLLMQVAIPCALFADSPVTLTLKGGTNTDMTPQIDYMEQIFKRQLMKFHADFEMKIVRRGFYPKGGGHVIVDIEPVRQLHRIKLTDQGKVLRVLGQSFTCGKIPTRATYVIAAAAKEALPRKLRDNVLIDCYKEDFMLTSDTCCGIRLVAETSTGCYLGGDALGSREWHAETVGRTAGEDLVRELECGTVLDYYAQDQIIMYMALAAGRSAVRLEDISPHTRTAMRVTEQVAKTKFTITTEGKLNLIEVTGLGVINENWKDPEK